MTQAIAKPMKNDEQEKHSIKASRILELTKELQEMKSKRKAVAGAFTLRIKEISQDISDVLNDVQTANEIVESVHEPHDLKII